MIDFFYCFFLNHKSFVRSISTHVKSILNIDQICSQILSFCYHSGTSLIIKFEKWLVHFYHYLCFWEGDTHKIGTHKCTITEQAVFNPAFFAATYIRVHQNFDSCLPGVMAAEEQSSLQHCFN